MLWWRMKKNEIRPFYFKIYVLAPCAPYGTQHWGLKVFGLAPQIKIMAKCIHKF